MPAKLEFLRDLAVRSAAAGKRPYLALVRTLGNLASTIIRFCQSAGSKVAKQAGDDALKITSAVIRASMLVLALKISGHLFPVAGQVADLGWLTVIQGVLQKQVKDELESDGEEGDDDAAD